MKRFTPTGRLVLAGLIASAVVGVDTRQTTAYQVFCLLLSLFTVSAVGSIFFRARLSARRRLPRFATAGERLAYSVVIQNLSPKPQRGLYLFENFEDVLPTFQEFLESREPQEDTRSRFDRFIGYYRWLWLISGKQVKMESSRPLPVLLPGSTAKVDIEITPPRRGHLHFTGLTIARPDPLGLLNAFIHIPVRQSVLVLPKRYHLPRVDLAGSRKYHSGGIALASSVGDSEEFISLRDYRPGDPLRRIHWKSWAKIGKPVVKEYQDEFFVRHALVLDTFSQKKSSDRFEAAVSVASSFACSIQTQESLLDLMFVGTQTYCFSFGRGLSHTDKALEILASVSTCTDKPFNLMPSLVLERSALLTSCVCILLSWDEERKQFIDHIETLGVPVLVLVITDGDGLLGLDPEPVENRSKNFHLLEVGKIRKGLAGL